ncbi:autotransporter domain-containing protein [Marinibaculum pumilum]|uniref:Autotransporter domain-containing protein n=1 Tax=Marinibaculum pumilum TaxID=1766165 RepID=A0ABV7LA92_9PROT
MAGQGKTKRFLLGTAAAAGLLAPLAAAHAISVRDDVAAAAGGVADWYDSGNAYPNVGSLRQGGQSSCTGSLINARTLLTAAHCFEDDASQTVQSDAAGPQMEVSFSPVSGTTVAANVQSVVVRPDFRTAEGNLAFHDIAIVALDRPVAGITPVILTTSQPAAGGRVLTVGYGGAFTGSDPAALVYDGKRRFAYNVLDFVAAGSGLPADRDGDPLADNALVVLAADFDRPGDPSYSSLGSAEALEGEGATVAGDSGGPLFLVMPDGSLVQVGVLAGGDGTAVAQSIAVEIGGQVYTGYGDLEIWTNVANYLDWLSTNAFLKEVAGQAGDGSWSSAAHWSGGVVPDNSTGYVNNGGARYYNVTLNQAGTTVLDMDPRIDSLMVDNDSAVLDIAAGRTLTAEVGSTLAAGTVAVAGSLVSPWLRLSGGTLSGSGTVTASQGVTQTGGTISPGGTGAIGSLGIAGPFTQSGGILLAELSSTAADRLAVSGGTASLKGGLQVALLGETPPDAGTRFAVVTGDAVDAASLADPAAIGAVTFTLERSATGVTVLVGREELTDIGADADQDGVAAALDAQRGNAAFEGVFDALDDLPQGQIREALEDMSEVPTTAGVTGRASSAQFLGAASQRVAAVRLGLAGDAGESMLALQALGAAPLSPAGLAEASRLAADATGPARLARPRFAGPVDGLGSAVAAGPALHVGAGSSLAAMTGTETDWGGWLQPYGTRTLRRGNDQGSRYDATLGGAAAGIDYRLADGLIVGASLGYARADVGYLDSSNSQRMRSYQGGLYAGWWDGPWSLEGGLGLALNRYENRRDIVFGTVNTSAEGRYDGTEYSAYAEGGYRFDLALAGRPVALTPVASLQALRLDTGGYTETGAGALNLAVSGDRVSSVKSGLGLSLATPFMLDDGRRITPEVRGRWLHEFADTNVSVDSRFATAGGAAFQVASDSLGRDAAVLGAGLQAELGPRLGFAAGYDVQLQSGLTVHAVTAKLRLGF